MAKASLVPGPAALKSEATRIACRPAYPVDLRRQGTHNELDP
jgi:hypothetical protein